MENNDRKGWIGGSDIASIMGIGWKTPLQVWAEKTGKIEPEDISEKENVWIGTRAEDFIAKLFEEKSGMKVRRLPETFRYTHSKHPFMRCQIDRLIQGEDENVEIKNVGEYRREEWEGDQMPAEVICQVQWGLGITGRKRGWGVALVGGNKLRYKPMDFDYEFFRKMEESALIFWEKFVLADVAPIAVSGDEQLICDLTTTNDNQTLELSEEWETALARELELAGQIKSLEEEKDNIKARIKQVVAGHTGIKTTNFFAKRIDVKACEYMVKRDASWYVRTYKNKEKKDV